MGADQFIWVAIFVEGKETQTLQWLRLPTSLQSLAALWLLHSQPVVKGSRAADAFGKRRGPAAPFVAGTIEFDDEVIGRTGGTRSKHHSAHAGSGRRVAW